MHELSPCLALIEVGPGGSGQMPSPWDIGTLLDSWGWVGSGKMVSPWVLGLFYREVGNRPIFVFYVNWVNRVNRVNRVSRVNWGNWGNWVGYFANRAGTGDF
ncbi:hypothetical protein BCR42DRAFT_393683 [Absidia repens]|uniref:Uncharacterized protein n=1 Tax=Absidia repens TaxID=90262 RepID=A0A1X2ID13_9FUNG|nr:hypothetical protein BCR42DRAFT_393683 [Absidia repens]